MLRNINRPWSVELGNYVALDPGVAKTVDNNKETEMCTLQLPVGRWFIKADLKFKANKSGGYGVWGKLSTGATIELPTASDFYGMISIYDVSYSDGTKVLTLTARHRYGSSITVTSWIGAWCLGN